MCVFSVSIPVGMPKLWGGVVYNRSAALPWFQPRTVASPSLDSGFQTRIDLSPTRQSYMHANDNGRVNRYIGNERMTDTGGTNYFTEWDFQLPCLWQERPCSSISEHPNIPLPRSVRIRYCAWVCTLVTFPSKSFLSFRNCGLEPINPNMGNTKLSSSKPLAHAGIIYLMQFFFKKLTSIHL